jgi:XRE family aerobic/anaerobic benzoate catabolism transcriptional regulator
MKEWKTLNKEEARYLIALGKKIEDLRLKKGISQIEFARRLKTGNVQIARIENGEANSSIIILKKIASELQIPLEKLIKVD